MMTGRVLGSSAMAAPTVAAWRQARKRSPGLDPRPEIELVRPGAARLAMKEPVILGNGVGCEDAVLGLQGIALGEIVADELGVDGAVDDAVRDVNAEGSELARHALRQRAEREFG